MEPHMRYPSELCRQLFTFMLVLSYLWDFFLQEPPRSGTTNDVERQDREKSPGALFTSRMSMSWAAIMEFVMSRIAITRKIVKEGILDLALRINRLYSNGKLKLSKLRVLYFDRHILQTARQNSRWDPGPLRDSDR